VDPHCFDADPDPAENLKRIRSQIQTGGGGKGVDNQKMCIPPGKIVGTPLTVTTQNIRVADPH